MTLPLQRDLQLRQSLADVSLNAARLAASLIRSRVGALTTLDWREKARADFVSDVDVAAESLIVEHLLAHFPNAGIVGEELSPSAAQDAELAFIVDPLDGTTNFLHGYPQYAVSIAALHNGAVVAAVVLDVARDEVSIAQLGQGAWRDGSPIRVSTIAQPALALVGTGFPFKNLEHVDVFLPQLKRIISSTAGVRRAGAAALDLTDVACGRLDAFWELSLAPWDFAAGMLIIREAGGLVTNFESKELLPVQGPVVASNGLLHDWFLSELGAT